MTSRSRTPTRPRIVMHARAVIVRASSTSSTVRYFAYGSNMNPKTFEGVRAMRPLSSVPVVLRGYELAFNVPGLPLVEPSFASVRVAREGANGRFSNECHGVAHLISLDEWQRLVRSEGSYDVVDVDCEAYDGSKVACKTLTHRDLKNFGERAPSKRYANLLREGARHHKLNEAWVEYLDAIETFEPVELNLAQQAALMMSVGPTLLAAAPVAAMAAGKQVANGDGRQAIIDAFVETQDVVWGVQNAFFASWSGDGKRRVAK